MKGHRILVVDDDPDFQELIADILIRNGYEPIPALGGIEGIDILAADPGISLLILDVMMPDLDGYEVCKKIKESDSTALPIIFLTAKAQPEDVRRAYAVGGDDYIVKPFEITQLIEAIEKALDDRPGRRPRSPMKGVM